MILRRETFRHFRQKLKSAVAKDWKKTNENPTFYFAHEHCCLIFIMHHEAAVAAVLEFVAKSFFS
jgi:hypothetical protein